jgi:integrase
MASVERRDRDGVRSWVARWRGPDGRQRKRTFPRKLDALRHLTGVESRLLDGSYVDPARGRITVGEWATKWYAGRVNLKPKTLASYDSLLSRRIRPTWETTPLCRVEHSAVVTWVAEMRADGLSASRTRQAYHLLTAMLNDAVKDSRLSRNPAAGVDLPRLPKAERRYLTHQQVEQLANECGEYRTLVLTLAYCGLRWGEAAALKVRRVDLMRGRLDIAEAMTEVNGKAVFGMPKTHQVRSVPVPRFLRDELMVQLAGKGPDDFVFPSPAGAVLRVNNWRRGCFNRAAEQVGLAGLVPHELRHTAASLAVSSGASIKGVQAMLGHASATLTLDRYGHLFPDELDAVAERLDVARSRSVVPRLCPEGTVTPITERALGH